MNTTEQPLSIKELAGAIRRSTGFVYKMRMAGFPMDWDFESRCLVSTPARARAWIEQNGFKVCRGMAVKRLTKDGHRYDRTERSADTAGRSQPKESNGL